MVRVELRGLRQIESAMRALPQKLDRKILNDGLLAGARVVRDEARMLAPQLEDRGDLRWRRGALKRAIRAARIRPTEYTAEVVVSVRKASKQSIAAAKARRSKSARGMAKAMTARLLGGQLLEDPYYWFWQEFGTAKHQAANGGRGFMRPGFEAKKMQAIEVAIKFFRDRVQKEIEKLGRTTNF